MTVMWINTVDTGNLDPGAFSSAQAIGTVGAYHARFTRKWSEA